MSRSKFICADCKIDTGKAGELYFIKTDLWLSVVDSIRGMLCVGCLESRLGRKLRRDDFTDCYLNKLNFGHKSNRLVNRLTA